MTGPSNLSPLHFLPFSSLLMDMYILFMVYVIFFIIFILYICEMLQVSKHLRKYDKQLIINPLLYYGTIMNVFFFNPNTYEKYMGFEFFVHFFSVKNLFRMISPIILFTRGNQKINKFDQNNNSRCSTQPFNFSISNKKFGD